MKGDIQKSLAIYKEQLSNGYIQTAYIALTKYVAELKGKFPKNYSTSNIGFGYLDYTYFYFTNDYVKNKKLKFAMVLNHEKIQFEVWLCARTADIRKQYWDLLKDSKWNKNVEVLPLRLKIGKHGMAKEIDHGRRAMLQFSHERLHLMGNIFNRVGDVTGMY